MRNVLKFGVMTAAVALSLAACGSAPETQSTETSGATSGGESTASAADVKACMVSDSGGFTDKSFNQSGYEGLKEAEAKLGIKIDTAESQSDTDFIPNIENMVQGGCDIIIGVGYLMADAMTEAAIANPDISFALVDSTFGDETLENARPLVFNTAEASYLAGYVSAGMSEGKVGTYLGMNIASVAVFADGFADGVAKYNEAKGTSVELLGWDKESQDGMVVGSFDDSSKGKQFTDQLIQQGADVIMPIAGQTSLGTLAAAKESGTTKVVWVDADGYESTTEGSIILTSVIKEIGAAVYTAIEDVTKGTFNSEAYVGTLENEGVSIAPFHDFEDLVSEDLKAEVQQLQEDIISGKIVIETTNAP